MRKLLIFALLFISFIFIGCNQTTTTDPDTRKGNGEEPPVDNPNENEKVDDPVDPVTVKFKLTIEDDTDLLEATVVKESEHEKGETVTFKVAFVTDISVHVYLNGTALSSNGRVGDYFEYEFIMPEEDSLIKITFNEFYYKDVVTFYDVFWWYDGLNKFSTLSYELYSKGSLIKHVRTTSSNEIAKVSKIFKQKFAPEANPELSLDSHEVYYLDNYEIIVNGNYLIRQDFGSTYYFKFLDESFEIDDIFGYTTYQFEYSYRPELYCDDELQEIKPSLQFEFKEVGTKTGTDDLKYKIVVDDKTIYIINQLKFVYDGITYQIVYGDNFKSLGVDIPECLNQTYPYYSYAERDEFFESIKYDYTNVDSRCGLDIFICDKENSPRAVMVPHTLYHDFNEIQLLMDDYNISLEELRLILLNSYDPSILNFVKVYLVDDEITQEDIYDNDRMTGEKLEKRREYTKYLCLNISEKLKSISLTPFRSSGMLYVRVGWQQQIGFDTYPTDYEYKDVYYKSSNEEILTIDENGLATFLKPGIAWILVSVDGIMNTYPVNVEDQDSTTSELEYREFQTATPKYENGFYKLQKPDKCYIIFTISEGSSGNRHALDITIEDNVLVVKYNQTVYGNTCDMSYWTVYVTLDMEDCLKIDKPSNSDVVAM